MKKLELKHILPYIPFKLKAQDIRTKEIRIVTLLHFTCDLSTVGHNQLIYDGLLLSKHLPILSPLSDLTKEIQVNGERFVPYKKIKEIYPSDTFSSSSNPAQWSLRAVEKLLEWHFDVYGLIENDLAIDINTL
jgi:hypothetical protein